VRVVLIEPAPADHHVFSGWPFPRLGLPLLGTLLRSAGHDVTVYCEEFRPLEPEDYIDALEADLIGLSTTTSTAPRAYALGDRFRSEGKKVVIGGSHVTFIPDEALGHADYCVLGEGERALAELARRLEARESLAGVPGLAYHEGGRPVMQGRAPFVKDLDGLPAPDLSLIKGYEKLRIKPVQTSRGCPHNCTFCSVTGMFGRAYRVRSVERVLDDLEPYRDGWVFFYDDHFCANKRRTKELLAGMMDRRMNIRFTAQVRAEIAKDLELVRMMKRAGCYAVFVGFESACQETLDAYNKGQTVAELAESVRVLKANGIKIHGMFVFGSDRDGPRTIKTTTRWALRSPIDTVQFMILTPLPGSQFYVEVDEAKRILTKNWSLYDGAHVVFKPWRMSPYELQRAMTRGMERFYDLARCVRSVWDRNWFTAVLRWRGRRVLKDWERANRDFLSRFNPLFERVPALATARSG
jgi:radical SAM superfamily enzyme YgiQ (UPF0313 family)